jgi:hypothetical protein
VGLFEPNIFYIMKKFHILIVVALASVVLLAAISVRTGTSDGFVTGTPKIQSMNALAFGPDGVLFIGDSKSASVFALNTGDATTAENAEDINVKKIDQRIAEALGTKAEDISIEDIAVNPVSKKVYCAVQMANGTPVLLRIEGEKITNVSLENVKYSSVTLNNSYEEDAKDQRGRPLRVWTVSDLAFDDGKLLVSGLSNQEFSSTFRSIPFPFTNKQDHSTLEIYHAAHGRLETYAPIKTFTTSTIKGTKYLVASYTCTPLVLFPMDELKPGAHVKGRTVAEMGSGNSPLDMISLTKKGESFLLMANSSRPVFKVNYKSIESFEGSLTTPVEESFATEGVDFVSLPVTNVLQLDRLDDSRFVLLQRKSNGDLDLWTGSDRYL